MAEENHDETSEDSWHVQFEVLAGSLPSNTQTKYSKAVPLRHAEVKGERFIAPYC
jgi:hypothetical protein